MRRGLWHNCGKSRLVPAADGGITQGLRGYPGRDKSRGMKGRLFDWCSFLPNRNDDRDD